LPLYKVLLFSACKPEEIIISIIIKAKELILFKFLIIYLSSFIL